jgi:hypothetical protein
MVVPDKKPVEDAQVAQPSHDAVAEIQRLVELEQTSTALSKRMEKLAWIVAILAGILLVLTAILVYGDFSWRPHHLNAVAAASLPPPAVLRSGMARSDARNVNPSLSSEPRDKLLAALGWHYGKQKGSAEYQCAPMYYDLLMQWHERLSADDKELVLTLADVMASAHKAAAEGMAASLPPAPRNPLWEMQRQ